MRPSPIQLKHVIYTKVSVTPCTAEKESPGQAVGFDFDGVNISSKVGIAKKPGQDDDPRDFLINLEVAITNKEGKPAPYDIDVGVVGVFNVLPALAKDKREDLVTVNGASILYGVIRELVLMLTSRFVAGSLTLPGMNFEDTVPSAQKEPQCAPRDSSKSVPESVSSKRSRRKR